MQTDAERLGNGRKTDGKSINQGCAVRGCRIRLNTIAEGAGRIVILDADCSTLEIGGAGAAWLVIYRCAIHWEAAVTETVIRKHRSRVVDIVRTGIGVDIVTSCICGRRQKKPNYAHQSCQSNSKVHRLLRCFRICPFRLNGRNKFFNPKIISRMKQSLLQSSHLLTYIRKTPKPRSGNGALRLAERARPRTRRVSAGSMMPSSQRRAVE